MPTGRDEVLARERRLRRSSSAGMLESSDAELTSLLQHIGERRSARRRTRAPKRPASTPGAIAEVTRVAPDIRIFRVGRPPGFTFRAGQHVKVGVAGDGKSHAYSIASAPGDRDLEFCIELVPGGRLTPRLFALRAGGRLEIGQAKGELLYDEAAEMHLMIGTVTGIAPLRSTVRDALGRAGPGRRFIIVHGASYADELPYRAELEQLAASDPRITYMPTVSRPGEARNQGWTGATGRAHVVASRLAGALDPTTTRVYAAGHPEMVAEAARDLGGRGFAVSTESFG